MTQSDRIRKPLFEALQSAFADVEGLRQFIFLELNQSPDDLISEGSKKPEAVMDLVQWAERTDSERSLIERLVETCPSSEKVRLLATLVQVGDLQRGVEQVEAGMARPAIRQAVERSLTDFEALAERVSVLLAFKSVHDLLHSVEYETVSLLRAGETEFPHSPLSRKQASICERQLRDRAREAGDLGRLPSAAVHRERIEEIRDALIAAADSLQQSLAGPAAAASSRYAEALDGLCQIIWDHFSAFNNYLNQAARALSTQDLERGLIDALTAMRSARGAEGTIETVERGTLAIPALRKDLSERIREHDRWQRVDDLLRLMQNAHGNLCGELRRGWKRLSHGLVALCGGQSQPAQSPGWMRHLCAQHEQLERLLDAMPTDGPPDPAGEIAAAFDGLRQTAADRFWDVDRSLKEVCESMGALESSLRSLAKGSA